MKSVWLPHGLVHRQIPNHEVSIGITGRQICMDAVITRIMEIEKKSASDIERAENSCRENIDTLRRALEEEKERTHALIIARENTRLKQALAEFSKQKEEASLAASREYETLFQDPAKVKAVKEKIIAILLVG